MIAENLLQFIWQYQYFNTSSLTTTSGEKIQIANAGQLNTHQGPDFLDAKIKIGSTLWAGSVEIHQKTSDWNKHNHQIDNNYSNVILHVVWDADDFDNNIPVLELKGRVPGILLERYDDLLHANSFIPCEKSIHNIKQITWISWKDRLLAERMIRKSEKVLKHLQQNNFHWEETFWWLLASNFGAKVNSESFEAIAQSIPLQVLAKHKNQIHQIECLLFGQAGLLNEIFSEEYPQLLKKEYTFLKKKYQLQPICMPVYFLRMRPGNFPTIRLAQLAALIHQSIHLFSKMKEAQTVTDVRNWLLVTANDYWHYHYQFEDESVFRKKKLGVSMIDNIIINTICPILFAFGNFNQNELFKVRALNWLEQIAAEKNSIIKGFENIKIRSKNAYDSQALLELKNAYCAKKRCLSCAIGLSILKNK